MFEREMFLFLGFIGKEIYTDRSDIRNFYQRCIKRYVNSDKRDNGKMKLEDVRSIVFLSLIFTKTCTASTCVKIIIKVTDSFNDFVSGSFDFPYLWCYKA